jgi:hypothetical protein
MTTEKKVIGGITLLSIALLIGGVFFLSASSNPSTSSNSTINSDTSVPESEIVARNGMHWHPKVSIYIKGEKQPFANGIGLNGGVHNPIHTHDDADKDIVHMEFQGLVTKNDTKLATTRNRATHSMHAVRSSEASTHRPYFRRVIQLRLNKG